MRKTGRYQDIARYHPSFGMSTRYQATIDYMSFLLIYSTLNIVNNVIRVIVFKVLLTGLLL
jgi:hypothetical protein